VRDGVIALSVDQVITFERPRTAQEVDDLIDAITAACCGPGHASGPGKDCDPGVCVGGGYHLHYADDPDADEWR
jgi:hypothetical protein